jgi:putative protease
VEEVAPAFELKPEKEVPLMITKHCIRFGLGQCPVHQNPATELREPLFIINNNYRFRLAFNCKRCEMEIFAADNV